MSSSEQASKKRLLPLYAWILYGILALSLIIYAVAVLAAPFAAWFNGTVGAFARALLAALTSWLSFSLAEMLIYCLPIIIAALAVFAWRHCGTWRELLRYLASFIAVCSLLFSIFVFTFGTGYHTETLDRRLGLETGGVSVGELKSTALLLAEQVNEAALEVSFGEDGFSVMPYDIDTMNAHILAAYCRVSAEYGFVQELQSRVKPVLASRAMSYTHITGVYTYFTGEANINVYFPDYTIPFTAAHELAHQRGIARENEANFVAFLATVSAHDPYIRYSAYLNLYEYVANALWQADREAYREVLATLSPTVLGELRAYAAFFEQFEDSVAADISETVNDTYLKVHGNEAGIASYGLVVELAVAYYRE